MSSSEIAGLVINSPASIKDHLSISKDGYSFDKKSNKWVLNKDRVISFQSEILALDARVLDGFRKTLATYAEEMSAHHTSNMYFQFQRLVRDTNCHTLDANTLLNWRAYLGSEHAWYLGALRGFLISWYDYGYYGVSKEMVSVLEDMRLPGNEKGVAVSNRCPHSGAFTSNEALAVADELIELLRSDKITFESYSYVSLVQATARRAIQLRQLKACDLIHKSDNFYLNIPRAKQRGGGFRCEFRILPITEELYLTLLNLLNAQIEKIESITATELSESERDLVPLFTDFNALQGFVQQGLPLNKELLQLDILHMSTTQLKNFYMDDFKRKQRAISERTGDIIHISARRFRHTRGTRLGRKGLGSKYIAEALDHSDSQNVKVYVENTADTVQYIDKAIGSQLAPFADAFKGKIIEQIHDGERGNDPSARIPNKDNEVVGACGTNEFCVNGYEACYLCRKFRPLLDAPHSKVLESLYAEKELRLKTTGNVEYASTKDRVILAVEWVVAKCKEIRVQRGEMV